MEVFAFKEAFDTAVLWGCGLGLGGIALAALALGLSRCPARVRVAVRRLGGPTVFVLGGFMAFATLEGSVTRAHKERCAESAGGVLDRIDAADTPNTSNPVNPVNPVKDSPRLPASNNSAFSDSNLSLPPVTNLCFCGIERGTGSVTLGLAWPDGLSLPNGRLDVFGNWRLAPDGWTRLAQVDVSGAQSPVSVEIGIDGFPTDAMARTAFFRLATQVDTDGDGLSDAYEAWTLGTDPANADTDGDGLNDGAEISHGTDLFRVDTDCDGLPDGLEVALGTDPCQPDTDGDGMDDGWEHENGFDPAVDNATDDDPGNDADADPDDDGLANAEECAYGTDPRKKDTDGDGTGDAVEIAQCSDPADASDEGRPNSRVRMSLCFGDHSGSHSEKYRLTVTPAEGRGGRPSSSAWINANYGACETRTAFLKPGWRYEVRLAHAGTKPGAETDYDYTLAQSGDLPPNVILVDGDSLFGVDDTSTAFAGEGKVANLYALDFTIVSDRLRSYDRCEEGQLIDSRTATVTVYPSLTGLDGHAVSFEATPVETGELVNDGHGTEITFTRSGASVWKTSKVYWYGVLPDRDCYTYRHPYALTLKVDGQEALTRKLSVHWPERRATATFYGPLTNTTRPGPAIHYNATSGGFWYCTIIFEEFDKSLGLITSEPSEPGELFTWSGQYADKVLEEEEFHMKQFRGEVPLEQGGQGDCYTVKGLKYFIAQQAKTNANIATSTWIVKGSTAEKAEKNCEQVIKEAVKNEMAVSRQIMASDRGFLELKAKEHVGYNAGLRYHCTYLQKHGVSPKNHTHPAYLNNE